MHIRNLLVIPVLFGFSTAVARSDAAPKSAHADIVNVQGMRVGTAKITPTKNGVRIAVDVSHLPPGEHGIHLHTVGKCELPAFTSAGAHFNPTAAHHGANNT